MSTPEIVTAEPRQTAVVHLKVSMTEIEDATKQAMEEVAAAVSASGVAVAGPYFTQIHRMNPDRMSVSVGVMVDGAIETTGRVEPSELPGGRIVQVVHEGSHDELGTLWARLDFWMTEQDLAKGKARWEAYEVGPPDADDASQFRTTLNRAIKA